MVFWEYKTELFLFLFLTEGTDIFVNLIAGDVWVSEYKIIGALSDEIESWY